MNTQRLRDLLVKIQDQGDVRSNALATQALAILDEDESDLHSLLLTMKVPESRFDDLHWLNRNLGIQNKDHPNLEVAMKLLKSRLKEQK
jgi:hypothetical protein